MLTFFISLLTLLMFLFYYILTKSSPKSKPPLPPGPRPWPYIGCIIDMLRNKPTFRWIHKLMDEMHTKILCIRFGNVHVVAVSDPNIAQEFLKKNDSIFSSRPDCMSGYVTSGGYLTTVLVPLGDHWKKMRKVLAMEILSPSRHKWLQCKRDEEANNLLRYIYNQCENVSVNQGVVDVRRVVQQYSGNVIRKLMFGRRYFGEGKDDGGPGEEELEHVSALLTILFYSYAFCVTDYLPWLRWITDFDGHERTIRKGNMTVRKYQDHLIDERVQQWRDGVRVKENDLLDVFINLENPRLTIDEIKAQIVELQLAAVDNPSNGIEWAMAEMMNEPRILDKAVKELDYVVGKERLVQESDLPNLNYIKACAKEAYRLHPVAPFNLPHVSTANAIVAGYFIPKGSHVILSRIGLGRNPDVWEDPLRFIPERHMISDNKEVVLTDHELKMLSFSIGRRGCAGVLLGSTMTVMLLARLVHGFSWELTPGEACIDLTESHEDLLKAKPLLALAKPRLSPHLYPID